MTDADRRTGAAGWIGDPVVMAPDVPGDVGPDPHEFARGPGLNGRPDGALPGTRLVPYSGGDIRWTGAAFGTQVPYGGRLTTGA